ncbi:NADH dehydrogenase subunit 6 (mitochondrion) [Rhinatrema bivittatum]|uniref:NADH-ubiquinone oxidoreductase chain 6 n=1 Tax=Rhinatrema bivittatum TaxID=194408 RepID=Q64JR0_RHIBI|nr:NADH dehydrogenase subunit 6 [Rhinatrema bivittatum]AAS13729.1 NADH dehydrogenase subunit 6 [Rhinatrema bivittatum]
MTYVVSVLMVLLVAGLVAVASNPSPYFAAFGLVMASGVGCWVLVELGMSFLSLVLFLVYLGGMLVVFSYSASLAAEPYPEAWGSWSVLLSMFVYLSAILVVWGLIGLGVDSVFSFDVLSLIRSDWGGVSVMYDQGGAALIMSGWVLFLTLFVVLELTRGFALGAVCAV